MGLMHNLIVYYYKDFIFQFLHDLTRCFKIYWLHIVGRLGRRSRYVHGLGMDGFHFSCTATRETIIFMTCNIEGHVRELYIS